MARSSTRLLTLLHILYTDDKLMKKPKNSVETGSVASYGDIKVGRSAWLPP